MNKKVNDKGFTLIEAMITLVMIAIMSTIAIPAFWDMFRNNKLTTKTNSLVSSLNFARSEAVYRGTTVSVCSSSTGTQCSGTTNWNTGWLVFIDEGVAGTVDGTDQILKVTLIEDDNINLSIGTGSYIQYASTGALLVTELDKNQDLMLAKTDDHEVKSPEIAQRGSLFATIVSALLPIRSAHASQSSYQQSRAQLRSRVNYRSRRIRAKHQNIRKKISQRWKIRRSGRSHNTGGSGGSGDSGASSGSGASGSSGTSNTDSSSDSSDTTTSDNSDTTSDTSDTTTSDGGDNTGSTDTTSTTENSTPPPVTVPIPNISTNTDASFQFNVCDGKRSGKPGTTILILPSGQVRASKVVCN